MNAHRLAALLTGAAIVIAQPFYGASSVSAAVSIIDMAKGVTVFIQGVNGPDSFGSGVIIAKTAKGYSVLTAAHVVSGIDQFTVKTKDGLQYAVKSTQRFPGMDLAIVQFDSNNAYEVARLGNSDGVEQTNTVYVAGYPKPGRNITVPLFTITDGRVASIIPTNESSDGYGLAYSNPTRAGMSGGPVFNEAGEVIAIHGRKEGETDGSSTNGAWVNLGIPINRYKVVSAGGGLIAKKTNNDGQAQAEAQRQAQVEAQQKVQAEVQRQAQVEAQQKAQAEAQRQAQAEAQRQAQAEAQRQAQAEAQRQAQAEAQQKTQNPQTAKSQQPAQGQSADTLLASVSPMNLVAAKRQALNAPTSRQVCEDIRINTIITKRCRTEATAQFQESAQAPSSSSNSPESYVNSGNTKVDSGRYKSAVEDYTAAIERNPSLAAAFFNRGLARHKLGQRDVAIADFSKAADLFRSQGETAQYQKTQAILQALTQSSS
jgi:tetratricopeptide (TPR) repeat protein